MQLSKFTPEQKQQLLANLDIEVTHRTRQLESWLADTLAAFRNRHERRLAYIPHLVRGMTMADFGDKYDGDVQAALRGLQKERVAVDVAPIDRNAMKRKWAPPPEEESEIRTGGGKHPNSDQARAAKNPRIAPPSPQKKKPPFLQGSGAPPRSHTPKTPGITRQDSITAPSPSPRKLGHAPSVPHLRPTGTIAAPSSPTKPTAASLARQVTLTRVPSTSTFKPAIPPKTPMYPPPPRWPRKDESMLSINGSPLANPYELGLDWLTEAGDDAGEGDGDRGAAAGIGTAGGGKGDGAHGRMVLRRTVSNIVIRRDLSFVTPAGSNSTNGLNHQAGHSRTNSQSQTQLHSRSDVVASNSGHVAARVAVPTRDGHLLEFNPLLTSPAALDKLEGITDSAKKQAKEDMSKLVQAAVAKWNLK